MSREHININRHNQQVRTPPGPFKFFALQDAVFDFSVTVRNFELIHVLMISHQLGAINGGLAPLGSGKNKGYGKVTIASSATLTYYGMEAPVNKLMGISEHPACTETMRQRYGLRTWLPVDLPAEAAEYGWKDSAPWRWSRRLSNAHLEVAAQGLREQFTKRWPEFPVLAARAEAPGA